MKLIRNTVQRFPDLDGNVFMPSALRALLLSGNVVVSTRSDVALAATRLAELACYLPNVGGEGPLFPAIVEGDYQDPDLLAVFERVVQTASFLIQSGDEHRGLQYLLSGSAHEQAFIQSLGLAAHELPLLIVHGSTVPEPGTIALFNEALNALGVVRRAFVFSEEVIQGLKARAQAFARDPEERRNLPDWNFSQTVKPWEPFSSPEIIDA